MFSWAGWSHPGRWSSHARGWRPHAGRGHSHWCTSTRRHSHWWTHGWTHAGGWAHHTWTHTWGRSSAAHRGWSSSARGVLSGCPGNTGTRCCCGNRSTALRGHDLLTGSSYSSDRSGQPSGGLRHGSPGWDTSSCCSAYTWTPCYSSQRHASDTSVFRGRSFYRHGNQILSSQQDQSQDPFLLSLRLFRVLRLDLPELVAVTEDEVHVFIEGLEGPDEDATVLQDAPHPEVDVLQHLAALTHRHVCRSDGSDSP